MPLLIEVAKLASKASRSLATSKKGARLLDLSKKFTNVAQSEKLNPLQKWLGKTFSFANSIASAITVAIWNNRFNIQGVFGWLVNGVEKLKRFDWNASDKQLKSNRENQSIMLASVWGGAVGNALGWVAGIGVGAGVGVLCPVIGGGTLAKLIASNVAEEALEEAKASFGNAIAVTVSTLADNFLVDTYINFRGFIKKLPDDVKSKIWGEENVSFINDVWGKPGGANYSFNSSMDMAVDSIPNKQLKAFVENLLEEAWDSFVEAGFIIAQTLDEGYQQNRLAMQAQQGVIRTVELQPDKNIPDEKVLITAPTEVLKQTVANTLTNYRMLANRDVGCIVGQPLIEAVKGKPMVRKIIITMYALKEPPYTAARAKKQGTKLQKVIIEVPDVKRNITWAGIKQAVGGANGYMWGRFRATMQLDNQRQVVMYASSVQEAEDRVKALLALTDAKMLAITVSEERKEGRRATNTKLYKDQTKVYPAFFTVINQEKLLNPVNPPEGTRGLLSGDVVRKQAKVLLWTEQEPPDFDAIMNELFKNKA